MNVLIATPAYNGLVTTEYLGSVAQLLIDPRGHAISLASQGDSMITRARNNLVATFLDNESYTHLFWIDGDIGFEPDQFFRLLEAGRDVVAAAYPLKRLFEPNTAQPLPPVLAEASRLRYVLTLKDGADSDADGFLEVRDAGTGFMCISRTAILCMVEAYPALKYQPDQWGISGDNHFLLFDTSVEDGRYLTEDYTFCRRWQQIGGQIWLDTRSVLSHVGSYKYAGNLPLTVAASEFVDVLANEDTRTQQEGQPDAST